MSWEHWTPDHMDVTFTPPRRSPMDMVEEFRSTMKQDKIPFTAGRLIREEYIEWETEYLKNGMDSNVEAEFKELCDLLYVIYGYANCMGWDIEEGLERVHKNNMARCIQPDGSIKYREDGKVMKNPDAPKVQLGDLI